MKSMFLHENGKVIEKIEFQEETKWIFIKYKRGNFRKSAYILKNDPEAAQNSLEKFFLDCHASKEIISDLKNPLKKGKVALNANLQEFINFLIKTSSVHIMVGIALGLCIFGGYQLGAQLDKQISNSTSFTVIGVLCGLGVGCVTGYMMMKKYLDILSIRGAKNAKSRVKEKEKAFNREEVVVWPIIETSLYEVSFAVQEYSNDLPPGIKRTILVKEDNSIDFQKLAPYLKGIPNKPFYMSKESYHIFEEREKNIPPIIDKVQKAVYLFYKMNGEYPMMPFDSLHRVNYHQLIQDHYLEEKPIIDLYMIGHDGLISHLKPEKKHAGGL